MNYPFETTKKGYPILDTEEKLQWYMNRLLHRDVDLYYVNAEVNDLETVWLKKRKTVMQASMIFFVAAPTLVEPDLYGRVDRSVVPVLRAIHARRDAEMEQRRIEVTIEANEKQQKLMVEEKAIEKEIKAAYRSWWKSLFKNGKEQECTRTYE